MWLLACASGLRAAGNEGLGRVAGVCRTVSLRPRSPGYVLRPRHGRKEGCHWPDCARAQPKASGARRAGLVGPPPAGRRTERGGDPSRTAARCGVSSAARGTGRSERRGLRAGRAVCGSAAPGTQIPHHCAPCHAPHSASVPRGDGGVPRTVRRRGISGPRRTRAARWAYCAERGGRISGASRCYHGVCHSVAQCYVWRNLGMLCVAQCYVWRSVMCGAAQQRSGAGSSGLLLRPRLGRIGPCRCRSRGAEAARAGEREERAEETPPLSWRHKRPYHARLAPRGHARECAPRAARVRVR